jgi:hypothetical protein
MDYVNIPFHCVHCHRVGHVVKDCSFNFHTKNFNSCQEHGDVALLSVVSANLNSKVQQNIPPLSIQMKEDVTLIKISVKKSHAFEPEVGVGEGELPEKVSGSHSYEIGRIMEDLRIEVVSPHAQRNKLEKLYLETKLSKADSRKSFHLPPCPIVVSDLN